MVTSGGSLPASNGFGVPASLHLLDVRRSYISSTHLSSMADVPVSSSVTSYLTTMRGQEVRSLSTVARERFANARMQAECVDLTVAPVTRTQTQGGDADLEGGRALAQMASSRFVANERCAALDPLYALHPPIEILETPQKSIYIPSYIHEIKMIQLLITYLSAVLLQS